MLLVQIAVPSRTDVPEYQRLRSMVHEIVGRINGQYGELTGQPASSAAGPATALLLSGGPLPIFSKPAAGWECKLAPTPAALPDPATRRRPPSRPAPSRSPPGTLTHVPIYHLDRQLSFHELVALYAITDVALVTSLRDGMNLVSYEYVACQRDNAGVLILSEFAGAAQSLGEWRRSREGESGAAWCRLGGWGPNAWCRGMLQCGAGTG